MEAVTPPAWITRTLCFPEGDVHQCRLFLQAHAEVVVEAAMEKIAERVGRPVTLGQALELLCAEYLAGN